MKAYKLLTLIFLVSLLNACNQSNQLDNTSPEVQTIGGVNDLQSSQNRNSSILHKKMILQTEVERSQAVGADFTILIKILLQHLEIAPALEDYLVSADEAILDKLVIIIDARLWEFAECDIDSNMMTPDGLQSVVCDAESNDNAETLSEITIEMIIDNFENPEAISAIKDTLADYQGLFVYIDEMVAKLAIDEDIVNTIDAIDQGIENWGMSPADSLIDSVKVLKETWQ